MPRSQALLDAIGVAGSDHDAVIGLESGVADNPKFTFMAWHPDSPHHATAQDIRFIWTVGQLDLTWWLDISVHDDTNPFSFRPVNGHASWGNGPGLLVTIVDPDDASHGVAFLPDGAPFSDDEDDPQQGMLRPATWVGLGRAIYLACCLVADTTGSADDTAEFAVGWRRHD